MAQRPSVTPEMVQIKGADKPVAAQRLVSMEERHHLIERVESNLVGRQWEMSAVEGLLTSRNRRPRRRGRCGRATGHRQEPSGARGVCDGSHPWCRGVHCLLRVARQPGPLPCGRAAAARGHLVSTTFTGRRPAIECAIRFLSSDAEDLLLFDDLLGIADPDSSFTVH